MNELININFESDRPTVSGRELHEFLGVGTPYHIWFPRVCEYGFVESIDFLALEQKCSKPDGGRPSTDHQLTIEMAKEISMLQRNEKGKQARLYFIQLEKDWNSPEKVMARALRIAEELINNLKLETNQQKQIIGELKPKADYTTIILNNKGLVTITQIAKDYGYSGQALNDKLYELKIQYKQSNQWLLYAEYHDKGYTHSKTVNVVHKDGTQDVKIQTKWTQKGRLFIYDLLKKNNILPSIEKI